MDIAAFVGFAEQGPIGIPVPVEDVERFRDVFGGSVEVARNEETGRMDRSYLGSAVDTFFRNGGQRCWVVRVGEELPEPANSQFAVPGLTVGGARSGGGSSSSAGVTPLVPARCRSRSQGSGFDGLRVGTVLRQHVFPRASVTRPSEGGGDPADPWLLTWAGDQDVPADGQIQTGELLRVGFGEDWYLDGFFESIPASSGASTSRAPSARAVRSRRVRAFRRHVAPFYEGTGAREWMVDVWLAGSARDEDPDFPGAKLRREPSGDSDEVPSFTLSPASVVDGDESGPWTAWLRGSASGFEVGVRVHLRKKNGTLGVRIEESVHGCELRKASDEGNLEGTSGKAFLHCRYESSGQLDGYRIGLEPGFGDSGWEDEGSGSLLRITEPMTGGDATMVLGVSSRPFERPAGGTGGASWTVREHRWHVEPTEIPQEDGDRRTVRRLRMDLLTWQGQELTGRLRGLGFSEAHPRGWMSLPTDDEIFAFEESEHVPPDPGTFEAEVFAPRPAWAGPAERPAWSIPLGMGDRPDPERAGGRRHDPRSPSQRDGLGQFDPRVFVDEELVDAHTEVLERRADRRVYVEQRGLPAGLHSLWSVREVTLLGLPDVLHRDWTEKPEVEEDRIPTPLAVPDLREPEVAGTDPHRVRLQWTVPAVQGVSADERRFEIEEATDPEFRAKRVLYGPDDYRLVDSGMETSDGPVDVYELIRYVRERESETFFFRVRLRSDGAPGPWSATRRQAVPEPDFSACGKPLEPPVKVCRAVGTLDDVIVFDRLEDPSNAVLRYEVEVDSDPAFGASRTVWSDPTGEKREVHPSGLKCETGEGGMVRVELGEERPALLYVRVRAEAVSKGSVQPGPWSCTMIRRRALPRRKVLVSPETYDESGSDVAGREALLEVQRAAMRFAAARGDVLTVLGLPEHDEEREAQRHVRLLTETTGGTGNSNAFQPDEERTLSFGAVYHPWVRRTAGDVGQIRSVPPDGAVLGLAAGQAIGRGPWYPPANVPLEDVRTLLELQSDPDQLPERLNLLQETPRGVLTLDASTLAREVPLRPISGRRILSLVRRLAEREGPELVFGSNGPRLRSRIAERFDRLLRRLFERGALAGTVPAEGYRVVADESVNPPERLERGEIIVELRVAPNRPLEFLTVRLVQRGPGRLAAVAA